jgi:hypothetical protein
VAVGDGQPVTLDVREALERAIDAGADLRRRLTAGTAAAPEVPVGIVALPDLGRRESLVLAVLPLDEVVADLGRLAEAGDLRSLAGA